MRPRTVGRSRDTVRKSQDAETTLATKNMKEKLGLPILLLALHLCGCNDANVEAAKISEKLNAAEEIAAEIQKAHKIEGHPSVRLEGEVARIELNLEDPNFDHQSLATEVTKLKLVQAFQGSLHLIFVHREKPAESDPPTVWITYDAHTGKQLTP